MILLSHSTTRQHPQHAQETYKIQRTKQIIQQKSVNIPFFLFQKLKKNNKFSDRKEKSPAEKRNSKSVE
jgi:hypothetical protein